MTAVALASQKLMVAFACATALLLAGCASSPPRPDSQVTDEKIVHAVLNELYCAVKLGQNERPPDNDPLHYDGIFSYNEDWVALIDLSLSTALEGSVSPEVTMVAPFNALVSKILGAAASSYNLSIGASVDQTATTLRDNKFLIDINQLLYKWKNPPICEHLIDSGRYLEGGLGLKLWLTQAIAANRHTRAVDNLTSDARRAGPQPAKAATVITLSGTFTFAIKASAHLGPLFITDRLKGGASSLFSYNRNENNFVNIVLTPNCLFEIAPTPDAEVRRLQQQQQRLQQQQPTTNLEKKIEALIGRIDQLIEQNRQSQKPKPMLCQQTVTDKTILTLYGQNSNQINTSGFNALNNKLQ
jgi:hypothetical protein